MYQQTSTRSPASERPCPWQTQCYRNRLCIMCAAVHQTLCGSNATAAAEALIALAVPRVGGGGRASRVQHHQQGECRQSSHIRGVQPVVGCFLRSRGACLHRRPSSPVRPSVSLLPGAVSDAAAFLSRSGFQVSAPLAKADHGVHCPVPGACTALACSMH